MKTLTALVLASAMATTACNKPIQEYNYHGQLGDEHVQYMDGRPTGVTTLDVTRPDGTLIEYKDLCNNQTVDVVTVIVAGKQTIYVNDAAGKGMIEESQKQYDNYLARILDAKKRQ